MAPVPPSTRDSVPRIGLVAGYGGVQALCCVDKAGHKAARQKEPFLTEIHRFTPSTWSNVLADMAPALRIACGDRVVTETLDAAGTDACGKQKAGPPNPMNGPILVEGAEPGDALRVDILRIDPARATGWSRAALAAKVLDPEHARILPPRDRVEWIIDRKTSTVRLEKPSAALENLILPYAPMIGCFGVAPPGGQAI